MPVKKILMYVYVFFWVLHFILKMGYKLYVFLDMVLHFVTPSHGEKEPHTLHVKAHVESSTKTCACRALLDGSGARILIS